MLPKRFLAALVVTPLIALAACSSSSTETNTDAGRSANLEAAQAAVDKATALPETITQTEPLTKSPPKGVKLAYLNCEAPGCAPSGQAVEEAGKALGWDVTVITAKSATPGAALQQAIDGGNEYIILNSFNMAAVGPQMAKAKEKGIVVIGTYMLDKPTGRDGNGLSAVFFNDESPVLEGQDFADWMTADSKGTANVLMVNIPTLPSLNLVQKSSEERLKQNCPACELTTLDVSFDQMASGAVPGAIVSHLKTHPKTNYLYLGIADLFTGVVPALKTAGLEGKVKTVGNSQAQPQMQSLVDGTSSAWNAVPLTVPWSAVDYAARVSVEELPTGTQLKETQAIRVPIIDAPEAAQELLDSPTKGVWEGPTDYQDQFIKLWNVK
ncbi:sugar ABC transporter substrate-binding protein [Streptomyces sp. NBC_01320]|uniref:sugar ABC transporter substrate-binding protein n=1 Tax=Streptomyces sp. NBC_01320 TaxID=2903824 RepID=UPI002E0E8E81|nr:substrate-binding domain-containing protein [Streptomyces sp. NBC_01320]